MKVYPRGGGKNTLPVKQCFFHFKSYLAGKEIFYKDI